MTDASARERALDTRRSFIVQAPAGSGKTMLLTQRFLALLASSAQPEEVLAITFTRKAAGEMRQRIVEALLRAQAGEPGRNPGDARALELAQQVLAHAAGRGWSLLEQPARLRIQTIDSLNQWLAARLPVLSRAGSGLEPDDRPQALYAAAAARAIARIGEGGAEADAIAAVLRHLDNDYEGLADLLARMLPARDHWLRLLGAHGADVPAAQTRALLEQSLVQLLREPLAAVHALVPDALGRRWVAAARAPALRRAAAEPDFAALAAQPGPPPPEPHALPAWQCLARLALTQKGEWRAQLTRNDGFPPSARADKQAFLELLAQLGRIPGLQAALARTLELPPPRYSDQQWAALEALIVLLRNTAAELGLVFAERGVSDFVALARAALDALGAEGAPSDLALALDYRLQHILVDEFQDTSALQVQLLERLTAGWQAGDGRTLFCVGDPMQSIYRFRQADVAQFLKVRDAGIGDIALEPLQLTANFRARPGLVEWVNTTFAAVLPARDDFARGAVSHVPCVATRPAAADPAAVTIHALTDADAEDEAARVVALVRAERRRDPQSRIAVLGRSRTQLTVIARALAAAAIRFQGVELVPLAERAAVRDLLALTRALCHRADRVAWLACLRAPWCGLTLPELLILTEGGGEATVPELLADEARLARLPRAAAARLARTRACLATALAQRGRRPLAALVEATWTALGGPATLGGPGALADVQAYLGRLDELARGGDLEDPVALEGTLADLYAGPDAEADGSLVLMTVHKAKGLEWGVVILSGLGRTARGGDAKLLSAVEFARQGAPDGLVLAPIRSRAQPGDPLESWLRRLDRERDELELGRLVYVASTRAQERLHLVTHVQSNAGTPGSLRQPRRGTLLRVLWPAVEAAVRRDAAPVPAAAAAGPTPAPRLARLADDWQAPAPPLRVAAPARAAAPSRPSEFEFEWVTAVARHVGTVVHEELERAGARGLEWLARAPQVRPAAWRQRLVELGVPAGQLDAALGRIRQALVQVRADPRGAWLFDPAHTAAASELALTAWRGGAIANARIDRTFVDAAGVRWIIDFKTSLHEGQQLEQFLDREQERYAPQLASYAALMRLTEPGRPIRLGLYFPLHAGWREWSAAPDAA